MDDFLKEIFIAQNYHIGSLRTWNNATKGHIPPEMNQKITDKLNELDDLCKEIQGATPDRPVS